jgi:LuxR family transcriptional regulator, maltose regulon positive regulatory protein
MRQRQLSIAKITRPKITGVYERKRLFKLLDQGRDKPVTWISGPAGSGKTTLVGSYLDARKLPCLWYQMDEGDGDIATFFYYMGLAAKKAAPRVRKPLPLLTPEYAFGIPTFTRRFFEELFSRLNPSSPPVDKGGHRGGFVLVFDNYHHIPEASPLHEIMQIGLSTIPEGVTVIVTSRAEPPAVFSGLRANKQMEVIGWDALRLTPEESRGIVRLEKERRLSAGAVTALHEKAGGWAAGLILMAKGTGRSGERHADGALRPEETFDYFAAELFDKAEKPVREFLLKTAILPKITPSMAERLTDNKNAGAILAGLNRRNYFTEKRHDPSLVYQYHPLFREFLRARVNKVFPPKYVITLQVTAARLLEDAGQIEAAAELYIEAADWMGLLRLLMNCAPTLVEQGRTQLLAQWLTAIPERIAAAHAWVLYWKGVCKLVFDPNGARPMFEQAFALFTKERVLPGRLLAWSGIVDTYLYAWSDLTPLDRWIDVFEGMWKQGSRFPSRDIEIRVTTSLFGAIFLRSPWRRSLPYWESCANKLLPEGIDSSAYPMLGSFLMLFYTLKGDLERASAVYRSVSRAVRNAGGNPVVVVIGKAIEAYYWWFSGARERSLQAVHEGLAAANRTGLHLWDQMLSAIGAYNMLAAGDYLGAETYMRGMESMLDPRRLLDVTHYHYNLSWSAVLSGDLARAREQTDLFMRITDTSAQFFINLNRVAMAHVLILSNEQRRASMLLKDVRTFLKNVDSALLEFKYHLTRAHAALTVDEDGAHANELRKAFAIGRARKIYHFDWWLPAIMQRLCAVALEQDIEAPYVRELIRRNELLPEANRFIPSSWPWPVKIYTLGRFRLEVAGKPLTFSGKVQKKPLEMLKALVAFGGDEVTEGQITDALWPDADGDTARISFKTTLHRLRQLIGHDEAIRVQEGKVSLDRRYCWTDVWAFESILHDAETSPSRPVLPSPALLNLEKAVALYTGRFLPGDEDKPWAVSLRERLRNKFLRAVGALGESSERDGKLKNAVEYYQKGLDADDLAEELYRRLMLCYQKLGRKADAVKTYERCRRTLAAGLGVEPSEETERAYAALRTGQR